VVGAMISAKEIAAVATRSGRARRLTEERMRIL
jgi:hypothetical protein